MFLSLSIIFIIGILGGLLFERIKLPRLLFYIILGILLGPSCINIIDSKLLDISSYLRQIALVIILTRSGLSLDIKTLKAIGRPAILMCFLPATFEIIGVMIFGPLFLNISITEALLLGSVLAAVSPAVVVPRMIELQNKKYGYKHHVPELVMAGASCDDIFVIILFYSFKELVSNNSFSYHIIYEIPLSIILGIVIGILFAILFIVLNKFLKLYTLLKTILMLGISFLMIGIEENLKEYVNISSLLGIMTFGILILKYMKDDSVEIKKNYNSLWSVFEILLFVLVGAATNIDYALSLDGLKIIGLLAISLTCRFLGTYLSIIFTNYTVKEKLFIIISYIPKATVQASIGAIALGEGLECGSIILTAAVISILITAPLGSILIDNTYKHLLICNNN